MCSVMQRVEFDGLLLLGWVVFGDEAAVAELQPGGEAVVGLDLVRHRGDAAAQRRIGQVPQQRHRPADLPECLVDLVLTRS
jgi:hypothetical protein